ncbi:MAG TPA: DUF1015 domain-containing protein [Tepidisphaeraceae bacterium]|nr:DUF1015 domain-containing protein [Tepidisphaeraceae bacterium]
MAHVRSFGAIHFDTTRFHDVSNLIAPPFDVLNEEQRGVLQGKHPNNIVAIDLPHIPPKAAGPAEVYERSAVTLRAWLDAKILVREHRTAFYPYSQTYDHNGRTVRRRGFFGLVRLSPFGQGEVVPHEKTYKGAIEDRFALMRATGCQMSPIFGLFNDRGNEITNLLYANLGRPDLTGTLDGVKSDLWKVSDPDLEVKVQDMMGNKPVYIADGHHRYTTALEYQRLMIEQNGGAPLPPHHPANYCMFCLISMNDPGLIIQATHRLIGGLENFDASAFVDAVSNTFNVTDTNVAPESVGRWIAETMPKVGAHTLGVYDGREKKLYQLSLMNHDVLKALEPGQSDAWRMLDVAILQRYLLDEVIQPKFAGGKEITKAYVSDPALVVPQTDGVKNQIALILQPTPLHALEDLGKHNEVMPQKSTYFFPKLATGMVINPLG